MTTIAIRSSRDSRAVATVERGGSTVATRPGPGRAVVAAGLRGAPGKPGVDAAEVSSDPNNRLEQRNDGLYVSNDLTPDPLAYYILAKG